MTPEQENELKVQIAEWEKVTREKDGVEEYQRVQFGLALSYAMLNNYKKFKLYIDRLYGATDNNFMHYVFFESSKVLNKKNVHIFEFFVQLFFAQNLVTRLLAINFKNKYEKKLAHYTTPSVANMILENDSRLRLNNIYNMNDPTEGDVLLQHMNGKLCLNGEYRDVHYTPFITCFTLNHDSLNQFRLYGKSNHK